MDVSEIKYLLVSYIVGGALFVIMAVFLFIFGSPDVLFNPLIWIVLPVFSIAAYPFVNKNFK